MSRRAPAGGRRSRRSGLEGDLHTVAVVVLDRLSVFEMAVACETFGIDRSDMGLPNYRLWVCAGEPGPLRTGAGFRIETPYGLAHLERADTIIVPGCPALDEPGPGPLLEALRRAHGRGARLASICTGAFVLAAAGLLDGRRATTHWMHAARLAENFPKVRVDPSVLYVDEGGILTSAGSAAGIDLCLHMVRLDHGARVANLFARRMVVAPHREGGQAQFVETPVDRLPPNHDPLSETLGWALANLDRRLPVELLAARSCLSPRTFARRFKAVTGTTPGEWLTSQRTAAAQRLLESSDEPLEVVAERSGFGSAANLRLHFDHRLGTSPSAYRRAFRERPEEVRCPASQVVQPGPHGRIRRR